MQTLVAVLCVIAALVPGTRSAEAHTVGQSYLYLQVFETSLSGRFEIALVNLNPALGLSGTADEITPENYRDHVQFLQDYYRDHVALSAGGKPLTIAYTSAGFLGTESEYVTLSFDVEGYNGVPESLDVTYEVLFDEDPDHRGFLLIESNWATGTFANESGISLSFSPDARESSIDLTSRNRWRGFVTVVKLGIEHIWEGIDHILFLLALVSYAWG